jgi:hypothetical protein
MISINEGDAVEGNVGAFPSYFREATGAEIVCIYGGKRRCVDVSGLNIVSLQVRCELPVEFTRFTFDYPISMGVKDEE